MKKKFTLAIQMDPLENLNLRGDTTFALGLEALARNYKLYFYSPNDMFYKEGDVFAFVKELDLFMKNNKEFIPSFTKKIFEHIYYLTNCQLNSDEFRSPNAYKVIESLQGNNK